MPENVESQCVAVRVVHYFSLSLRVSFNCFMINSLYNFFFVSRSRRTTLAIPKSKKYMVFLSLSLSVVRSFLFFTSRRVNSKIYSQLFYYYFDDIERKHGCLCVRRNELMFRFTHHDSERSWWVESRNNENHIWWIERCIAYMFSHRPIVELFELRVSSGRPLAALL